MARLHMSPKMSSSQNSFPNNNSASTAQNYSEQNSALSANGPWSGTPTERPITTNRRNSLAKLISICLLLLLVLTVGLLIINRQKLLDWWKLRDYTPPAMVVQLADQDTMNGYTRHLFYLNKPQILNTVVSFRQDCPENKNTVVLGCYHSGQNGIYVYNVPDPTLAGVQQVTAAHEVLHAVYARLSGSEKATLDLQLESFYKNDLHDPTVEAEVKLYQKTEPNDVYDEMDSTFGTEISVLPKWLNNYYSHFFTNRQAIVAYEQRYQKQLTSRENTITVDDTQLTAMQQSITSLENTLHTSLTNLNQLHAQLNNYLKEGDTESYNNSVDYYNGLVDAYNQNVNELQNLVDEYNSLVMTRNQVAGQLTTLDKALDTRIATENTQ